ncbi:MAG TPA: hypothetical protein VKP88_02870 [Candidatus Paceibacterota bacterium]|nr:hypothetical protein [Candidatus Paceibacterota bacterium]
MDIELLSADEIAEQRGVSRVTIIKHAQKLGIGKQAGRHWLFTEEQADAIKASVWGQTGRPPGVR